MTPTPLDMISIRGVQFAQRMLLHNIVQQLLQRDRLTAAFTPRALSNMPPDVRARIELDKQIITESLAALAMGFEETGISG